MCEYLLVLLLLPGLLRAAFDGLLHLLHIALHLGRLVLVGQPERLLFNFLHAGGECIEITTIRQPAVGTTGSKPARFLAPPIRRLTTRYSSGASGGTHAKSRTFCVSLGASFFFFWSPPPLPPPLLPPPLGGMALGEASLFCAWRKKNCQNCMHVYMLSMLSTRWPHVVGNVTRREGKKICYAFA